MYIVVKIEEFKYRGVQSMKGMYILHFGDESQLRTPIMLQWTEHRAGFRWRESLQWGQVQ